MALLQHGELAAPGERGLEPERDAPADQLANAPECVPRRLVGGKADVERGFSLGDEIRIDVFYCSGPARQVAQGERRFAGAVRPGDDMADGAFVVHAGESTKTRFERQRWRSSEKPTSGR